VGPAYQLAGPLLGQTRPRVAGWKDELGQKEEKKEGRDKERFCIFKREQPYDSNINLNSNTQKKLCTSMNATKETYGSLIKIWKAFKCL
jgi:hypothetical protein